MLRAKLRPTPISILLSPTSAANWVINKCLGCLNSLALGKKMSRIQIGIASSVVHMVLYLTYLHKFILFCKEPLLFSLGIVLFLPSRLVSQVPKEETNNATELKCHILLFDLSQGSPNSVRSYFLSKAKLIRK